MAVTNKITIAYRYKILFNRTLMFNFDSLPEELRNDYQSLDFILSSIRRDIEKGILHEYQWSKANIEPSVIEMPLVFYFDYISSKKNEFEKLSEQVEKERKRYKSYVEEEKITDDVLKLLIPNWKTLQEDKKATELCNSLANWSKEYNLFEDWVLDFFPNYFKES